MAHLSPMRTPDEVAAAGAELERLGLTAQQVYDGNIPKLLRRARVEAIISGRGPEGDVHKLVRRMK